jgi:fibronectin type 3 domain-containing protein
VDEDGNESALSPVALADVLDFGAPRPPVGITIETDTGKIVLRWQANTEKDMLGYHVFKATKDTLRAHFFQTTKVPIRQPLFVDQVPKGADYTFFYRIVAVDSTYNFSDFSPIIRGRLPDIVQPIAPIWRDVRVHKDRIELSWVRNPEQDIAGYNVHRRPRGESQWSKLNDVLLSPATTHFGDTSAVQGSQYEYMLQAIDDAKNVSRQSTIVAARRYDADPPETPASIDAKYDSTRHIVLLSWARPADNTLRGVVVFRSIGADGKFVQKSRLLQAAAFTDDDIRKGESYRYRVRAYDTSGNYSDFSEPVIVTTGRASR